MSILNEIRQFVISPDELKDTFGSSGEKNIKFIKLFGINLVIGFVVLSTLTGLIRINFAIHFKPIDVSLINLWFANLLIIPILEEIAFRLSLKLSIINLSLSVSIISFMVACYVLGIDIIDFNQNMLVRLAVALMGFITTYFLLRNKRIFENVTKVWKNNYKAIFYLFLSLFVTRHIDSYELNVVTLLFFPMLLTPQFVSGIFLSFVRIKLGFAHSIVFHVFINIFSTLPQMILYAINF